MERDEDSGAWVFLPVLLHWVQLPGEMGGLQPSAGILLAGSSCGAALCCLLWSLCVEGWLCHSNGTRQRGQGAEIRVESVSRVEEQCLPTY